MHAPLLILACCVVVFSGSAVLPAQAQQNTSASQSANTNDVEGTVASAGQDTFVVRTDDNQFQLFTYGRASVRTKSLARGARVRVSAGPPDENGTRSANDITVLSAASGGAASTNCVPRSSANDTSRKQSRSSWPRSRATSDTVRSR